MACSHCGASVVWDDDLGSSVCIVCGSLEDPSQSLLTSAHQSENSIWNPSTLKSFRSGNANWDIPGQGKESRERKNALAVADFLKSLAVSLNAAGLSPRAITLFNQFKAVKHFRWGRKSRLVAAACLSIAFREANRPDSLRDISSIVNLPLSSLTHEFRNITAALQLSLSLVDPSTYVSTLQAHLTSGLHGDHQQLGLPDSLVKALRPLSLISVAQSAVSLGTLLTRLSPDHEVLRLPTPPTACGIFMLALEAENRALLPLADLATYLGKRCQVAKGVVMARYKIIQDQVLSWVEHVPWLDKYETKKGRAVVSKRLVAARGLKDVITFQQDIWQKVAKPSLILQLSDSEDEEDAPPSGPPPKKRARIDKATRQATNFLLDPLKAPTLELFSSSDRLPTATYLLASASLVNRPPTRLQLLSLDRGGEDKISDDELFEPGEFDNLLRSEGEIAILRQHLDWPEGRDADDPSLETKSIASSRKRRLDNGNEGPNDDTSLPKRKSRLDMDALARFLASDTADSMTFDPDNGLESALAGLEGMDVSFDEDEYDALDNPLFESLLPSLRHSHQPTSSLQVIQSEPADDGEVILDGWRPPSPEHNRFDSRYEEERPP